MPKVIIPTPLRQYANKQESLHVTAATVGELLNGLVTQYADLRRHLYTDDGKLRSFVNVYLNDEDIRYLQKESTPVKDTDVVSIVPSIAGGTGMAFRTSAEPGGTGHREPSSPRQVPGGSALLSPDGCRGRASLVLSEVEGARLENRHETKRL